MSTVTPPPALQHPELVAETNDPDTALAGVAQLGNRYRSDRDELEKAIRAAIDAGATEKAVTEASGLANMTVRRILGKLDGETTKPTGRAASTSKAKKPTKDS